MKSKIAVKLTVYFSVVLLLFAIIIGGVFMTLFRSHTIDLYKTDMEKRAVTIAATLSEVFSSSNNGPGGKMSSGKQGGYGAYLKVLNDIALTDVWIVDENLELITAGHGGAAAYIYADLPQDADTVVKEVFKGNSTFSEGFSNLLETPTLTVGTPIYSNGKVIGALLLHSPVEGITQATTQGFWLLAISMLAAMILAVLLSILLSISFTRPLKKMQNTAALLTGGDYNAKTGVSQGDEIGALAQAIDLLSVRLDASERESENLLKLRRDFVANISHELRTPVTVIRGSLEALCDEVVTDPKLVKNYHHQMLNESIYLQRLVDDLLDLSRLQNTDFKIEMQELSVGEVLRDAVRAVGQLANKKSIEIVETPDSSLCTVQGDYGRLRQMLVIILDNAIKFTPENGKVAVTLKDRSISIKDNGPGIAQEDLPYIFDRFYKVKSVENKNGTGLGLSIAKQIAERHNIEVSVISIKDSGTEFDFHF